jgi:signal transduction histidine kinase
MKRPRVATVLLALSAAILLTPLIGVFSLRIYDTELIRQTESELLAQAAFVQAAFGAEYESCARASGLDLKEAGIKATRMPDIEISADGKRRFRPEPARLDMRNQPVAQESANPLKSSTPLDVCAAKAGERIESLLVATQEVTLAGIRVTDSNGVIAASTRREDVGLDWAPDEVVKSLQGDVVRSIRRRVSSSPDPPLDSFSRAGGIRIYVAFPVWIGDRIVGSVVVSRTPVSLQNALYINRRIFMGLLTIVLLVTVCFSALAAWAVGRPVRDLMRQIREIEQGKIAEPLSRPGTAEFEALSLAIAKMDKTLRQRNEYIRNFARNVSHEFKTPLTSIRGAAELLEDFDEMPTEKRKDFVSNISADAQRLERLVNRLHELARADTTPAHEDMSSALNLAQNIAREFNDEGFEVKADGDEVLVAVPSDVLDSMIRNLIENARQHGAAPVAVNISAGKTTVNIDVSDAGAGISSGNMTKIFEPFFTTARALGGTGLGLSIVGALADQYGGSLTLVAREPTTFRVVLPAVKAVHDQE